MQPERFAEVWCDSENNPVVVGSTMSQKMMVGMGIVFNISCILIVYLDIRFPTILARFQLKMLRFPSHDPTHPIRL